MARITEETRQRLNAKMGITEAVTRITQDAAKLHSLAIDRNARQTSQDAIWAAIMRGIEQYNQSVLARLAGDLAQSEVYLNAACASVRNIPGGWE